MKLKDKQIVIEITISEKCLFSFSYSYRVFRIKLKHLIWLKMTLKIIADMKAMYFYNHKDPPFDMKHQLMSADPVPVVKIDLK